MNVLLTGASAGFGEAIARSLCAKGHKVYGMARRVDKLAALKENLGDNFTPLVCDVRDHKAVACAVEPLDVDVLINNAGLALGLAPAQTTDFADWQIMIDTNITALAHLTHCILPKLVAKHSGYVINLGSIAGTYPYPGGHIYGATKAFVRQFSLNLRADLAGTGVRVTNVEPGLCGDTEFSLVRFGGDVARVNALYDKTAYLTPKDIADMVDYLVHTPRHVNINRIEVMPTAQSFAPLSVTKDS